MTSECMSNNTIVLTVSLWKVYCITSTLGIHDGTYEGEIRYTPSPLLTKGMVINHGYTILTLCSRGQWGYCSL